MTTKHALETEEELDREETRSGSPASKVLKPGLGRPRIGLGNQEMQSFARHAIGSIPRPRLSAPEMMVQRQPDGEAPPAPAPAVAAPVLLVEDAAAELSPGQMRRSEFLNQLKTSVCQTADQALEGTIWSPVGCPYIERWFAYYQGKGSQHIERALRQFAPETGRAASAQEYIPIVNRRVRRGIEAWVQSGSLEGVPAGLPEDGPQPGAGGAPAGGSGLAERAGQALAGIGRVLFKRQGGGAQVGPSADPQAVRERLSGGRSLDGSLKTGMESAFGASFAGVRVHTGEQAGKLAGELGARAFTVGSDIAFASGEYQPGTPVGDALIAHELAHVVQQDGSRAAPAAKEGAGASYSSLEEDADRSAISAVAHAWGGSLAKLGRSLPQLRSGLRLQSCGGKKKEPTLVERLNGVTDVVQLALDLANLSENELQEIKNNSAATPLLQNGVAWEEAMRKKSWSTLAALHRSDRSALFQGYRDKVIEAIKGGSTNIKIQSGDAGFSRWVEDQFYQLCQGATGFRLVIELLAAGQPVNLSRSGEGHTTERITTEQQPDAGRFISSAEGRPLAPGQQRAGAPTGSNIKLNPGIADNQVVLGGTAGKPELIEQPAFITFGHELIHALHNARGENISAPDLSIVGHMLGSPVGLVRNPVTGEAEDPEELRAITGQTSFQAPSEARPGTVSWATSFNLPSQFNISENMLREEHELPKRTSHRGGQRAYRVTVAEGETLDQMLGRYYLEGGGAIDQGVLAVIRAAFLELNPYFREHNTSPMNFPIDFPHGDFILLYGNFLQGGAVSEETVKKLRVRGSR